MLTKRIIPCLDVNNGRVVKGINFVQLRDAGDPVECGEAYSRAGADELVFLDITATSDARNTVADMVRRVAEAGLYPLYRRGRDPDHRGHEGHTPGRRRQGLGQFRGHPAA